MKVRTVKCLINIAVIFILLLLANGSFYVTYEIEEDKDVQEWWYNILLNDSKIGYQHLINKKITENNIALRVTETDVTIEMQRMGETARVSKRVIYYETEKLKPVRYEMRLLKSQQEIYVEGKVTDGKIAISSTLGGKSIQTSVDLEENAVFSSAIGNKIQQAGLEVGNVYHFQVFLPDLEQVVNTQVLVQEIEKIECRETKINTYKLKITYNSSTKPLDYYLWVDKKGILYKSYSPLTNLTTILISKEEALGDVDFVEIFKTTTFNSDFHFDRPQSIKQLLVRLSFREGFKLNQIILTDRRQKIEKLGQNFVVLTVKQTEFKADESLQRPIKAQGFIEYLKETFYAQSNDPEIMETANQIAGDESNAWQAAKYLNQWVAQNIRGSGGLVFASAKEVLDTGLGDCTEHAVLLCALARSLGIPSKICFGIAYGEGRSFGYHAWAEVYVGEWVGLDPTSGQWNIDATYIKFAESNLTSASLVQFNIQALSITQTLERVQILEYQQEE